MKKLLAIAALMIGTTSMASTVLVTIKTPKTTKSWFMPTTIDSTTINTVGNTSNHLTCTTTVQGKEFQLLCRQHGMIVLLYRDSTPQKDAVLATPKAIVAITTVKGKKK
jgi:hypothetical protein